MITQVLLTTFPVQLSHLPQHFYSLKESKEKEMSESYFLLCHRFVFRIFSDQLKLSLNLAKRKRFLLLEKTTSHTR